MLDDAALDDSVGGQAVRDGFARTPQLDRWWACGFPDLVLVGEHSAKKGPVAWLGARDGLALLPGTWPAEVVHMVVQRAADPTTVPRKGKKPAEIQAARDALLEAAAARGPADETVARAALDALRVPGSVHFEALYPVEALIGTAATLNHLLDGIEASDPAEMARAEAGRGALILRMAPMLLRLSPADHTAIRARLDGLFARLTAAWPYEGGYRRRRGAPLMQSMPAALDLLLGGPDAAIAMQIRNPWMAVLAADGAFLSGYFTGLTGAKWTDVAPRAAFYAPDAVIAHYTQFWEEYPRKEQQIELVETLSTLADPRILPWMLEMSIASKAKSAAKQWFVDHRDAVAEFVQGVCSDEAHRYHRGALALAKKMKL